MRKDDQDEGDDLSMWPATAIVALIEWLPNLTKTTIPLPLREYLMPNINQDGEEEKEQAYAEIVFSY